MTYLFVNEETGNPIRVGDSVETFRGEPATLKALLPPRHSGSEGHVVIEFPEDAGDHGHYFYASVIGGRYVVDND